MRPRTVDAAQFQRAVVAGCLRVIRHQRELNEINVFPVPDGDTGTNLASTLRQVADAVLREDRAAAGEVARVVAEAALLGARGNSGSILAQFLVGLAEGLGAARALDAATLARAARRGRELAWEAVVEPQEGTILSVITAWQAAVDAAAASTDVVEVLRGGLSAAREALARTTGQLEALRRAGVVDAGARGFVQWMEGFLDGVQAGAAGLDDPLIRERGPRPRVTAETPPSHRYCTECYLETATIDRDALRRRLAAHGDSLVLAGTADRLRVHIHTDAPEAVFELLAPQGRILSRKVEDLAEQAAGASSATAAGRIALVIDSACDLPEEFLALHGIRVVPVLILLEGESHRDKVEITPSMLYQRMERDGIAPTTSQPSPGDFKLAFEEALHGHESVIYIGLSSALSGTFQAAAAAARMVDAERIHLVDSRSVSAGIGLLAAEAVRGIEAGESIEQVLHSVRSAAARVRIYLSVPTTRYLVRGGRLKPLQGLVAKLTGIRPVLSLDPDGRALAVARSLGAAAARRRALSLALRFAESGVRPRFAVAHANAIDAAARLYRAIARRFPEAPVSVVDAAPAIGVHVGPGGAGVAVLTDSPA